MERGNLPFGAFAEEATEMDERNKVAALAGQVDVISWPSQWSGLRHGLQAEVPDLEVHVKWVLTNAERLSRASRWKLQARSSASAGGFSKSCWTKR